MEYANVDIDTDKIYDCGKSMVDLSFALREIITTIFDNIENLEAENIWVGKSSETFRQMAKVDKIQYLKLQEFLYKNGNYLEQYASSINRLVREVIR